MYEVVGQIWPILNSIGTYPCALEGRGHAQGAQFTVKIHPLSLGCMKVWDKMKILRAGLDIARFFRELKGAGNRVLFLDYDGTLAPFRAERQSAIPYPGIRELLEAIVSEGRSRLVIISGRSIKDLVPLLGLNKRVEIWGSHGRERLLEDGTYRVAPMESGQETALKAAEELARKAGLGERIEKKPGCLAFHVRGLDEKEAVDLVRYIEDLWHPIVDRARLGLQTFDGGVELRAGGFHKGMAVDTVLKETGEGTVAAYMGDDYTDEDAFRAIKGRGLGVLVRKEFRPTNADLWIVPPGELKVFLDSWRRVSQG